VFVPSKNFQLSLTFALKGFRQPYRGSL